MSCIPERRRAFDAQHEAPEDLLCDLVALEQALHEPLVRADRAKLLELLHPEFEELGRSGRRYTRADVLERLPPEAASAELSRIEASRFRLRVLGPCCAQLLYLTYEAGRGCTWRTSLWERESGVWRLRFHQATAASDAPEGADAVTRTCVR